jgi:hypothetical protein
MTKKLVLTAVTIAVAAVPFLVPATSSAATLSQHVCKPATPGFTFKVVTIGRVTCAQAEAVERYWVGHDTLGRPFWAGGMRWTDTGSTFPHGYTGHMVSYLLQFGPSDQPRAEIHFTTMPAN